METIKPIGELAVLASLGFWIKNGVKESILTYSYNRNQFDFDHLHRDNSLDY